MMDSIVRGSRRNFFMVSNDVFKLGLKVHDLAVYICLLRYADNLSGQAFPGYKTLAKDCNMGRQRVIDAVKNLEEKGLIKKEVRFKDGRNTSNLYIVFDAEHVFRVSEKDPGVSEEDPRGSLRKTPGVFEKDPEKYLLKNTIDEKEVLSNRQKIKELVLSFKKGL